MYLVDRDLKSIYGSEDKKLRQKSGECTWNWGVCSVVVVSYEIGAADDFTSWTETPAESGVGVVYPCVDDADCDTCSSESFCMKFVHSGHLMGRIEGFAAN